MKVEYIKDSEPHFKGTVTTVADEVGVALIENGVAKEVDPRTEDRNVAAETSQDGMSLADKRARGIAPAGFEGEAKADEDDSVEDEFSTMSVDELKAELESRDLAVTGKKADLLARLREAK